MGERRASFEDHGSTASWCQTEAMARASHALRAGGNVWLIDPVDSGDDVEAAIDGGDPVGVIQLLDRHSRDCAQVAARLNVPHLRLPDALPQTPFELISVVDRPRWRELAIWWPDEQTLVVSESLMTVPDLEIAGTGVGVHPLLRLTPPGALRGFGAAEHLLTGHGRPLHAPDAGRRAERALERSRREIPQLIAHLPAMLKAARA